MATSSIANPNGLTDILNCFTHIGDDNVPAWHSGGALPCPNVTCEMTEFVAVPKRV